MNLARGKLRIYLGAAPGLGKTYAMLAGAHRRIERGTDCVVAFVEHHDRPRTEVIGRGRPHARGSSDPSTAEAFADGPGRVQVGLYTGAQPLLQFHRGAADGQVEFVDGVDDEGGAFGEAGVQLGGVQALPDGVAAGGGRGGAAVGRAASRRLRTGRSGAVPGGVCAASAGALPSDRRKGS